MTEEDAFDAYIEARELFAHAVLAWHHMVDAERTFLEEVTPEDMKPGEHADMVGSLVAAGNLAHFIMGNAEMAYMDALEAWHSFHEHPEKLDG